MQIDHALKDIAKFDRLLGKIIKCEKL